MPLPCCPGHPHTEPKLPVLAVPFYFQCIFFALKRFDLQTKY